MFPDKIILSGKGTKIGTAESFLTILTWNLNMMKLPSLQRLVQDAVKVISRFPFEIGFALTGTGAATAYAELNQLRPEAANWCLRLIMVSNLGLLLALSATLFSESRGYVFKKRIPLYFAAILITMGLLFVINPMLRQSDYLRFFLISMGFHLLVSFVAFAGNQKLNAFWQFNKTLFLRFLTGALYSAVLYLGLAAAIGSMNFLFNFGFEWDTFLIIWIWIVGMFQTIFFLSGIPLHLHALQEENSYPKGLKVFTQYVLIPLATVYLIILLAYELKILLQWNMPKGLVSSLILGYAVFGILSLLLVYPVQNQDGNSWIKTFTRSFYFLLIPLLVLLFLAIIARIDNYGITEERYFLIVLAIWLTFITVYFLFSSRQNIMLIPASLCIATLLIIYGPQSAFSVSRASQLNELKALLKKNNALKHSKLQPVTNKLDSTDQSRLAGVMRYLLNKHGFESLQPLITEDLKQVSDSLMALPREKYQTGTRQVREIRSLQEKWLYDRYRIPLNVFMLKGPDEHFVVAENRDLIPLASAEYLININSLQDTVKVRPGAELSLSCRFSDGDKFILAVNENIKTVNLDTMIKRLNDEVTRQERKRKHVTTPEERERDPAVQEPVIIPRKLLFREFVFQGYSFTLMLNSATFAGDKNTLKLKSGNGVLLLKKK